MNFLSTIKKAMKQNSNTIHSTKYLHPYGIRLIPNKNGILLPVKFFKYIGVWEKWSRININTYALCASIYQNVYTYYQNNHTVV